MNTEETSSSDKGGSSRQSACPPLTTFPCRNPNPDPKDRSLPAFVAKIRNGKTFAAFFTSVVECALTGDEKAIECVESYLEPTDKDLADLGVHRSQWNSMRKCTDVGLLGLIAAKMQNESAFQ